MTWEEAIEAATVELRAKDEGDVAVRNRRLRAQKHFAQWLATSPAKLDVEAFLSSTALRRKEPPTKEEEVHRAFAEAALAKGTGVPLLKPKPEPDLSDNIDLDNIATTMEPEMPKQDDVQDEDVDEADEVLDEEDVDEVPPSRRRAPAAARVQPIMVAMPAQRQRRVPVAAPRPKVLPRSEKVRVYKRDGGKRVYVNDYLTDDIGTQPLQVFLKEYVDPEMGDASGRTEYEVVEVDTQGRDKGMASRVIIESAPSHTANDPLEQLRSAAQLVQELKEGERENLHEQQELLTEAKKKALSGEAVNMNQLMMLMMMEKMMGGGQGKDDTLLKAAELLRQRGPNFQAPLSGFSGDTFNGPPPFQQPPPWAMMPPPPPPVPQSHATDKLIDLAIARLAQPPPEPKGLADTLKELAVLREFMGGGATSEVTSLRAELAALRQKLDTPKEVGGIENALASFERLSTVVQSLAPKLNMGGLTGALQNILTPRLGEALGNMLASGIDPKQPAQPPQGQAQAALPAQTQPTPPSTPAPQPAAPTQQLNEQPPAIVIDAVKALQIAQTHEVQVQRTVDLLQALYNSGVKRFVDTLEPALKELMQARFDAPRRVVYFIVADVRKELATPLFTDAVLAALITRAGADVPEDFARNAGKWTFTRDGHTVIPSVEAVPAQAVPEVTPTANAEEVAKAVEAVQSMNAPEVAKPEAHVASTLEGTPQPGAIA